MELTVPSGFPAAAWPIPDASSVRIAGAVALTGTVTVGYGMRSANSPTAITVCVFAATSFGTMAVICPLAAQDQRGGKLVEREDLVATKHSWEFAVRAELGRE